MWRFWWTRGYVREGRDALTKLLALDTRGLGQAPALVRALALSAAGSLAFNQDDYAGAAALHTDALQPIRKVLVMVK